MCYYIVDYAPHRTVAGHIAADHIAAGHIAAGHIVAGRTVAGHIAAGRTVAGHIAADLLLLLRIRRVLNVTLAHYGSRTSLSEA